jgi:hypothetical protein
MQPIERENIMLKSFRELSGQPNTKSLDEHAGDGNREPGTFLVIPYFSGDEGRPGIERPLDASHPTYACSSIVVNGMPGSNQFTRGVATSVTVDVANWGNGTTVAPVQIALWWAEPATGFTTGAPLGQAVVGVPTGGATYTSPPIVGIIPLTAPPHVCLFARVSSPFDAASSSTIDPTNDRHWAQLNLFDVSSSPNSEMHFGFWAGNPFSRAAAFRIEARTVTGERLRLLEYATRMNLTAVEGLVLELQAMALRRGRPEEQRALKITLGPGARRAFHLTAKLPAHFPATEATIIEILQWQEGGEGSGLVGSIGLIVRNGTRGP